MMVPLQSQEVAASSQIASVLHIAYDQTNVEPPVHLVTGGRELYTMIVVFYDDDNRKTRTFQHQRMFAGSMIIPSQG